MPPDLTSATLLAIQLQYSQISPVETCLPVGVAPAALLGEGTGRIVVGTSLTGNPSGMVPVVAGALDYIDAVASVLPINHDDERVVDALLAKRQERLAIKALRRREER